jgi:hypothetical protein
MRVFHYYPFRRTPGGGHKQIRILADNMRKLGHRSYLLPESAAFDDDHFYTREVPRTAFTVGDANGQLRGDDLVLLPEYRLDETIEVARRWPCRKAVYAQGGFLALLYRPSGGYWQNGIEFMIGVAPYIVALGPRYLGMPSQRCFYVPYPVASGPFAGAAPAFGSKKLAVCYMPRKLPDHISRIRRELEASHPSVPWVEIDGLPEREVASRMEENAIFLSTQNGEGFGLPAAEAMSRGCVVAGYRGTGLFPAPYATRENGLWARDRSIPSAVRRLRRGIGLASRGGPELDRLLAAGRATLSGFTEARALEALKVVVAQVAAGDYHRARQRALRLGLLGHLQACRSLWHARSRHQPKGGTSPGSRPE